MKTESCVFSQISRGIFYKNQNSKNEVSCFKFIAGIFAKLANDIFVESEKTVTKIETQEGEKKEADGERERERRKRGERKKKEREAREAEKERKSRRGREKKEAEK